MQFFLTRRFKFVVAVVTVVAAGIVAVTWFASDRKSRSRETEAIKTLKDLGAVVVMDGARRHAASVNLSPLQSRDVLAAALPHLGELPHVTSLDASRTQIRDDQTPFVAALPRLTSLSLNGTNITDSGVQQLTALDDMQSLYLASTHITDHCLPALQALRELRILDLSATKVTADLQPLTKLPQLEWLVLRKLSLHDEALSKLGGCQKLDRLSLEESSYSDDSLQALQHDLPQLSVDR